MTTRIDYANQLIAFNGGCFRAARRINNEGGTTPGWPQIRGATDNWHLRAVLPREIVFDVGDDTPWVTTRKWVTSIHDALVLLDLPHWVALSGGKGFHIHLMCKGHAWAEDDRWRWRVSSYILSVAATIADDPMLNVDHRLVCPNEGSRLVREFGAKQQAGAAHAKTLWWQDGEQWLRIPETRDAAYAMMPSSQRYPRLRPAGISRFDLSWTDAVGARNCPKSPLCLSPENWNFCDDCEVCA